MDHPAPSAVLVGHPGLLLELYGGPAATAVLLGGCLAAALLVTSSGHVRRMPRPAVWTAEAEVARAARGRDTAAPFPG